MATASSQNQFVVNFPLIFSVYHIQSDAAFALTEKKLPQEREQLRLRYPEAQGELWRSDEHHIGLKPILRRVWAKKGSKVTAVVKQRYQWMYVSGFVQPERGHTSWVLMPTVNVEVFELALAAFACEQRLGANKHLLLVLDRAG